MWRVGHSSVNGRPNGDAELKERARTAVHEAAHLAIAELYPCRALHVHAVSIADNGPFAGGLIADAPDIVRRSELRGLTAVLLAGFEAEWQFLGQPAFEHATTDLRQAYVMASALARHAAQPTERVFRQIQIRVRTLVARHWNAIEHLAVALVRHTVLDGDVARGIVRANVPHEFRYRDGQRMPPRPPGICRQIRPSDSGVGSGRA